MHLRKNRHPAQGMTNIKSMASTLSTLPQMNRVWQSGSELHRSSKMRESEACNRSLVFWKTHQKTGSQPDLRDSGSVNTVRKAFRGKSNVWRIARAWKFPEKGYIQSHELRDNVNRTLGLNLSEKQSLEMFNQFSGGSTKLNLQQFLSLIYCQPKDTIIKPKLYDISDKKQERASKILNLIHHIEQKAPPQDISHKCSTLTNFFNQSSNLSQLGTGSSLISQHQGDEYFTKTNFQKFSSNTQKTHQLNARVRREPFEPKKFTGLSQRKTRFGATPLIEVNNNNQGEQNWLKQGKYTGVSNPSKQMYARKLDKIRQYQLVQKQNIAKIDQKQTARVEANMRRKRVEKEAYEYSTFLQNNWH